MSNTHCEKCIFSNPVDSNLKTCEFDIPEKINKQILISSDNFNIIENYQCMYGFGREQAKTIPDVDIKNIVLEKAQLKYYLIVDLRNLSNPTIESCIKELNSLDIKTTYVSLIVDPHSPDDVYQIIRNSLVCKKWKMHVQVDTISFNDCINLILDTNLVESKSWCVLFMDYAKLQNKNDLTINKVINNLQDIFIIKQENFYGVRDTESDLHLLCLNSRFYKYLVSVVSNDILQGISLTKEVSLISYDF